jgi:hypothetical protein
MQRRDFLRGAIGTALAGAACARNPRGVGIGTVSPGFTYKFIPGDYAQASGFYNVSVAQVIADMATILAAGTSGLTGYAWGRAWGSLETSSSSQSMSPQYDNAGNWQRINYQAAVWPGSYTKIYFNANRYALTLTISELESTNLGNPAGYFVPAYIMESGGSVEIPNSPGSGSGTTYPIAPCYAGASSYGCFFGEPGSSSYGFVTPAWTNPGVVKAWQNCTIYLSTIATCPVPTTWSSSTTYSAGMQALVGSTCYTYINATATSGNALTNTSYWVANTPNYGGMTLDSCPQVALLAENDEVSYSWTSSQNASSGPTVNPPQVVTGAPNTNTNFASLYYGRLSAICAALKKTPYSCCYSWGVSIGSTADTTGNVAANVNANIPSRTLPSALSSITGLVFSTADLPGNLSSTTDFEASYGQQGYLGIGSPSSGGGAPPTPTYTSLKNTMPSDGQVQPLDLGNALGPDNYTSGSVIACMKSGVIMGCNWREWPLNDNHTSGGGWSGTNGYIYAALIANQASYPVNTTRPSSLP